MRRWPWWQGLEGGDWRWPAEQRVLLLLDGVRVESLSRRLYEWSEGELAADMLYAGTPWAEVSELSPWLVGLEGPEDPILRAFLAEGLEAEWGYLILGRAERGEVTDHLRNLIQVEHPAGIPMLLRLADPAVMAALLVSDSTPGQVPWGPIDAILTPDAIAEEWHYHAPRETDESPCHLPHAYRLSEPQHRRLQDCDRRRDVGQLMAFVDRHCGGWLTATDRGQRYAQLAGIVQEACELGFTAPREWALFCTLMQRLGITSWQQSEGREAWTKLLRDPGQGSGMARLEAALAVAPTSRTDVTT
ncbi:DUF4123 domain-containing protein [Aidingimonas halophila]|uniref:DUF4123 domain-containing protein n=1 Tax=Aidingimonas halophila TaxID=574349 RepID=A0A1H3GIG2_9GAMM|nr:DUF4123 domain-containing protein [Aidingimonas halophila]GHC33289.1 hypothetical protein GCM10008094_27650 [Aidingimonas halophila]SDY02867.1 protein of unknown function [Aidingimonas halophila]